MADQAAALRQLLRDEDPATVALIKRELVTAGSASRPVLRQLLGDPDISVASHVRDVLAEIDSSDARLRFEQLCPRVRSLAELEEAAWLLAQVFLPGLETPPYAQILDDWGRALKEQLASATNGNSRVQSLVQFFTQELKLRGNTQNYYDLRNLLLPCVIDSRLGIPTTLSLIYIFVGQRAGETVHGINLPGHFLIRFEDRLLDPFLQGREIAKRDYLEILAQPEEELGMDGLAANPRTMLLQILNNLWHILEDEEDSQQRGLVFGWLQSMRS
jgi:regulator of sirC expression with transglutaminase-like and TPR domain